MGGTGPLNSNAAAAAAAEAARRRAAEEARRRAEEEARKRAEEAARRRAAEEAARKKAAEEAARKKAEEAQRAQMAEKAAERREAYAEQKAEQKSDQQTNPVSDARMAKMERMLQEEARHEVKPTTRSEDAATSLAARIGAHEGAIDRKVDAADKVPGEAKEAVRDLNKQVTDQARDVVKQADAQVAQISELAEKASAGKTPEQKRAIMDEADKQSAAIYHEAERQVDKVLDQTYQKSGEILEKAEEKDNGGGLGGWLKDRVDDVADLASDAWNAAKDFVGDVTGSVGDAATAVGDFASDKVSEFGNFVAEQAYDKAIDPTLDKSALGEDNEYNNEKTGALGDLITNRLEPGESVFLKLEADAQIGGVQVGAGAQVQIKRVGMTDENGNPVTEPKDAQGRPPTELEVSLLADANVGVGLSVSAGTGPKGKAGDERTLGAGADAGISAQAGLSGQAEFKFRFNPNSQQDMNDMTGIFKTAAKTGLESAIPGIGPVLAASNAPDLAKDASAFASHLTEVRGEIGAYANASVNAGVSAGSLQNKPTEGADAAAEGANAIAGADPAQESSLLQNLKNQGLDAAQLRAELGASVGAEIKMGVSKDFRSGDTTLYFTASAQAQASATVGKFGEGVGGASNRTIAVKVDESGEIEGIQVKDTTSKKTFAGYGTEDVQGQRIDDEALALLSGEDKVVVTRSFKPEAVEDFKQSFADNKAAAVAGLGLDAARLDPAKMEVTNITGTHTEKAELGVDVKVAQLKVTLGHAQDVDLTAGPR